MPCMIRLSKSMRSMRSAAHWCMAGTLVATSDNPAETSTVSSMVPMVIGNLSQRELTRPKTAAVPKRRLSISRVVINCRPQC